MGSFPDVAGPCVAVPPWLGYFVKHRKCFAKLSRKRANSTRSV